MLQERMDYSAMTVISSMIKLNTTVGVVFCNTMLDGENVVANAVVSILWRTFGVNSGLSYSSHVFR